MASQDDDDLQLIRASASLLEDLEQSLPRLLWKTKSGTRHVHQLVRQHDLDYVLQLIEPFQPEPQLLDARLKSYLPTTVDAYLSYLQLPSSKPVFPGTVSLGVAVSRILYTFCKVRGEKVITGFLNNEPKFLDLILSNLEACTNSGEDSERLWETSYILLLWLRHLLLAPFDLASISGPGKPLETTLGLHLSHDVPSLTCRVLAVAMHFMSSATKEQDAASKLLVRLVTRPDMQKLHLPTVVVSWARERLTSPAPQSSAGLHTFLGPLKFLVGMTVSTDSEETASLIPLIYAVGQNLMNDAMFAFLTSSAVTKKLIIKMLRNIALLSLQPGTDTLHQFFDEAGILEETIDYLLQSLGDRDTPVRFAASKALSMIILRLDPMLSHEVVQAVLDCMKEDMPSSFSKKDFSTVDPLRWHGLTLTLAHALFRRSASPEQLPEIVNALLLALTFEQRGATGSSIGSNVRDAACFGIWSFSRRYTTTELLSVNSSDIRTEDGIEHSGNSAIQLVAVHLLLSACLDPAGNIRRGSSAALQELIGRHPDQVRNGISLVQVVDYHAVGLRQRALIEVAHGASVLDPLYRQALVSALLQWRGVGAPDVASREMAAISVGRLCKDQPTSFIEPLSSVLGSILTNPVGVDIEYCHGSLLTISNVIDAKVAYETSQSVIGTEHATHDTLNHLLCHWRMFEIQQPIYSRYTSRALRAELFPAVAQLIASLAELSVRLNSTSMLSLAARDNISAITSGLTSRSEDSILNVLPRMVKAFTSLHSLVLNRPPLLNVQEYASKLRVDLMSTTLNGAGRAMALAAIFPSLHTVYQYSHAEVLKIMGDMVQKAPITEWRVVGLQALLLVVESNSLTPDTLNKIVEILHVGLNDYTITERGDVGSLVRAAAIACVASIWRLGLLPDVQPTEVILLQDMTRLSLEKLDRTRLQAGRCLSLRDPSKDRGSLSDVSSVAYFEASLNCLKDAQCPEWKREAVLKGCASSAGMGAEPLLHCARAALVETVYHSNLDAQVALLMAIVAQLKLSIATASDTQPLLELVSYLLDVVPSLQAITTFSWRNLLALVQKSHYKSNNIPKILAAVDVYRGLSYISSIRSEVLKKLISMLRTIPYPKVRIAVAECLYLSTGDDKLKPVDWSKPGQKYEA